MPDTFTPEQISQILEEFFKVVGTRQYIGARYVPIFGRKGEDSIEWDNTAPYEPLTIVLYQGNSYTSRQFVPVGVEITNQEFWAITGNYNAQVEMYRRETAAAREIAKAAQNDIDTLLPKADFSAENTVKKYVDDSVAAVQNDIDTLLPKADFSAENTVKKYIDENITRVLAFDTVADMQASATLKAGMVCHTNGFHAANDNGASFYVIDETGTANGMDVLTLQDGLFAKLIVTEPYVTLEQLGAYGNDTNDDTDVIQYAVSNYLYVTGRNDAIYKVTSEIKITRDYQKLYLNRINAYDCAGISIAGGWQNVNIEYIRAINHQTYPAVKIGYENSDRNGIPHVQLGKYRFGVAAGKNGLDINVQSNGYVNGNEFYNSELVGLEYSIYISFQSKTGYGSKFNQNNFENISFETSANGIYIENAQIGVNYFNNLRLNEMYDVTKKIMHVINSSIATMVINSSAENYYAKPIPNTTPVEYHKFYVIDNTGTDAYNIEINDLLSSTGGKMASKFSIRRSGTTGKQCVFVDGIFTEYIPQIDSDTYIEPYQGSPNPFGHKIFYVKNTDNNISIYLDAPYGYDFNDIKFIVPKDVTIAGATIYVKQANDTYISAYVIPPNTNGKIFSLYWVGTRIPIATVTNIE